MSGLPSNMSDAPRFGALPGSLLHAFEPVPVPEPYLVAFSPSAARLVGLPETPPAGALLEYLAGNRAEETGGAIATAYAGHQFGVWVPALGDGRACLLGEFESPGGRLEIQLKGAGPTRFCRGADGRAVLRSSIREFLASEAMHALGIPTTRALAVVGSALPVYRETPETAAVLSRVAPSHLRFGTFQWLFAERRYDDEVVVADWLIAHHYPDVSAGDHAGLFGAIVDRTAKLIAAWQTVGFVHGVMNTDNMSLLGLTIDYGPYAFMDRFQPGFSSNTSDHGLRYAFAKQPAIGLWNLCRLAEAMSPLMAEKEAMDALENYESTFNTALIDTMRAKLGLAVRKTADEELITALLDAMAADKVDQTRFLRRLADFRPEDSASADALAACALDAGASVAWLDRYAARLAEEERSDADRRAAMNAINPAYLLRGDAAERAIAAAGAHEFEPTARLAARLADPFSERPDDDPDVAEAASGRENLQFSCSS